MANGHRDRFCAALLSRVEGDEQIFQELCGIFLDDAPKRLAAIRTALDAGDSRAVRAAAHAFKGAAGVFDANDVVAAARRLEEMGERGNLEGSEAVSRELDALSRALIDEIRAAREGATWKS
jgi:HPt (histidine-containing phosphotransfer) domain-containing protein